MKVGIVATGALDVKQVFYRGGRCSLDRESDFTGN